MAARGFPEDRNVALVCVASTLGVVVPPSLVLILLGDAMMRAHTEAANVTGLAGRIINTQDVFHAALVPAALGLFLTAVIPGWRRGLGAGGGGGFFRAWGWGPQHWGSGGWGSTRSRGSSA